jgi:molybdopterin-synthase adenylyltransferase
MSQDATSVAMTEQTDGALRAHLLRPDGQEDVCLATYRRSHGSRRTNALLRDVVLPDTGERSVHGNASFTGEYVMRAVEIARSADCGIALLHSHPGASGWERMSGPDADAERSYAYLATELTGLPLVGMTLAGRDARWSARRWSSDGVAASAENVRVVGPLLRTSWNDETCPAPVAEPSQVRTISGWGQQVQNDLTRLRILIVGLGSVGLDVALRLAATGVETIGLMDFDNVETKNLDRLIGASAIDVWLGRSKIDVAQRLVSEAATASAPRIELHDMSICEPAGLAAALDYDLIFSCVDRPWPRAVLNTVAYSDLVPVIDGGIHIDSFPEGGMRNATWRSHVVRPGRPCLSCNGQLDPSSVALDRQGLLDDPAYIAGSDIVGRARQNVAALSVSVVASLLSQFVSFVVGPGGEGDPGPLQYVLSTHSLEVLDRRTRDHCAFEQGEAAGERRLTIVGHHREAEDARGYRRLRRRRLEVRVGRAVDRGALMVRTALARVAQARGMKSEREPFAPSTVQFERVGVRRR